MVMGIKKVKSRADSGEKPTGARSAFCALFLSILILTLTDFYAYSAEGSVAPIDEKEIGTVVLVLGNAFVKRGDVETKLSQGERVYEKDRVRTEGTSKLKIYLKDDSVITLGENTTISLDDYTFSLQEDTRSVVMNLIRGRLRAIVGKIFRGAGSRYEIKTPTSITGVRGTHFYIFAMENLTRVILFSGEVSLKNILESIAGEVVLNPGQMSIVPQNMPPAEPVTLSEDELNSAILETEIYEEEGMEEEVPLPGISPEEGPVELPGLIRDSLMPDVPSDILPPLLQEPLLKERVQVNVIIKLPPFNP